MRVRDIVMAARQRLGDTQTPYRWQNEELIDSVNSALSQITALLNPFTSEWIIKLIPGKNDYELPPYFHHLISVAIDGVTVPQRDIRGYDWVQKNLHEAVLPKTVSTPPSVLDVVEHTQKSVVGFEDRVIVTADLHKLYIYPVTEEMKKAVVSYHTEEQIAYMDDEINLPERFRDAILFYVLHMAHQSPVRADGEGKTVYYLNLFEKQIDTLRAQIYANKHSRRIRSNYNRI